MKSYDMRNATLAIAMAFSDAFNAGNRDRDYEPDIRAIIAANSDVPADRLDRATEAVRAKLPHIRMMLAILCLSIGRVPTREDVEGFIPAAYWEDPEPTETRTYTYGLRDCLNGQEVASDA